MTLASIAYWGLYSVNEYNTFHTYFDLAIFTYNTYFYLHYTSYAAGLQLLVFGNHISPDMWLLVVPFYALFQSPLTLLFAEDVIVSLAGLAVFFAVRGLTGRQGLALAFCAAFLLSPGIHGITLFDFHTEAFIPLFYILTFYFYMQVRKPQFYASLALLLGSLESVVAIVLMLGVALLVYEQFHNKGGKTRSERRNLTYVIIVASLVATLVYYLITANLTAAYSAGDYASVPQMLYVTFGSQNGLLRLTSLSLSNFGKSVTNDIAIYVTGFYSPYTAFALLVIFLGFGVALFASLDVAVLTVLPYLAGTFISFKPPFILPYEQYFAFAMPGAFVAATLGALTLLGRAAGTTRRRVQEARRMQLGSVVVVSCVIASACLCVVSPVLIRNANIANLSQSLLFRVGPQQQVLDAQMNSVLAAIPANASVAAAQFMMPHLTQREWLEDFSSNIRFAPQYIVVDFNANVSENAFLVQPYFYEYLGSNSYRLYVQNGTAQVYKRV